jgi:glycosyltransferase involved in cell wall biosynthesis
MKFTLSIAIPTMDRWEFLKRQLPVYLEHPRVDCVIVCDENGHDISEICAAELDSNPKLRLYQNEKVLGVYGNKRQCMLKAPTDYVAVLDSDNFFDAAYIDSVVDCINRDLLENNSKTIYCAAGNERLMLETAQVENRIKHFSGLLISSTNWNRILDTPSWNFLLNDGNAVWPKAVVKHLPDLEEENIVGTDSILAMRLAIQAGYTLSVEPTLSYVHTVHGGSHWTQNAAVSNRLLSSHPTGWKI